MNHIKHFLLMVLMALASSLPMAAHDFEVASADGPTIYYTITSTTDLTCAVSHKGNGISSVNKEDYCGNVVIPSTITYNNQTYTITSINSQAFNGCIYLKSVSIPPSVTSIGHGAFYGCIGLTEINIPASVKTIGTYAFAKGGLRAINVANDNPAFCSIDGVIYDKDKTTLFACPPSLPGCVIPNTITTIGEGSFYGSCMESINLPNSVCTIESEAFGQSQLQWIELPASLKQIQGFAFEDCMYLSQITSLATTPPEADYYTFYGVNKSNCKLYVPASAADAYKSAKYWSQLTRVSTFNEMPATFSIDGFRYRLLSLNDCTCAVTNGSGRNYGNIVIPASVDYSGKTFSVTAIGASAFNGCQELESVVIPEGVTEIQGEAFCYCGKLRNVTLPSTLLQIGDLAFNVCSSLESITIPASVKSIGMQAFQCCPSLHEISLPHAPVFLGAACFGDTGVEYVDLPNEITDISMDVFGFCSNLKEPIYNDEVFVCLNMSHKGEYTLPANIKRIASGAFAMCGGLTAIHLNNKLEKIGEGAFRNCYNLKEVVIPDGVTNIYHSTFMECRNLESVTFGKSISRIDDESFLGCSNIKSITIKAIAPPVCNAPSAFYGYYPIEESLPIMQNCTVYVPSESIDAYKSADGWKEFEHIEPIVLEDYIAIDDVTVKSGTTFTLPVVLKNQSIINSVGGIVTLPQGMSIEKNAKGRFNFKLNEERASAEDYFSISSNQLSDGSVKFLLISTDGTDISGNDGAIFYIPVVVDDSLEGDYEVKLSTLQLSDTNGELIGCPDVATTITVEQYTPGDVNNDGQIAPNDITLAVKAYLGDTPSNFVFKAADMNANGVIDPADITIIIRLYLNEGGMANVKESTTKMALRKANSSANIISDGVYLSDAEVEPGGEVVIDFAMDLERDNYTSLGGIITLPEGFSFVKNNKGKLDVSKNANVLAYHSVIPNLLNERQMKFYIYSGELDVIEPGLSTLISVRVKADEDIKPGNYTCTLTSLQLSDDEGQLYDASDAECTLCIPVPTTPNTLAFIESDIVSSEANVVSHKGNGDYEATRINIYDEYEWPYFDYTIACDNITYTRHTANNYITLVLPFSFHSEEAYTLTRTAGNAMTFSPIVGEVAPYTPVLIKADGKDLVINGHGVQSTAEGGLHLTAVEGVDGWYTAYVTSPTVIDDVTTNEALAPYDIYCISGNEFVHATKRLAIQPFRTFYLCRKNAGASASKQIILDFGASTAIDIATSTTDEGARYNMAGQRVGSSYKGIVIKNGKKTLVK